MARPVWLLSTGVATLLLLGFGLLFYSAWRHDIHLRPIQSHLDFIAAIEAVDNQLRTLQTDAASDRHLLYPDRLSEIERELGALSNGKYTPLHTDTRVRLQSARRLVHDTGENSAHSLVAVRRILKEILTSEIDAHNDYMRDIRRSAERELRITLGILVGLVLFTIPLGVVVKRRILAPLENLGYLMTLLSRHDYTSASAAVQGVDPMLRPLYINYNRMVNRLVSLEQEHQRREEALTDSVRRATRLLLQQHRMLAHAERLVAIGEIAATVAHELRNPLTSMHMALQNLRRDLESPDHIERIDMVISEINRMAQQLSVLLDSARQVPEPPATVDVGESLWNLATLVRYQLNEQVLLEVDVPENCRCHLPEARFRQCTLNLIINSGQMLDESIGHIWVTVRLVDNNLQIVVEDDGPGFPEQVLLSGVQAFGSWRVGGTGLGLIMVRRFVRDLGGNMHLENRFPRGARVTLNIPCGMEQHG